MSQARGGGPYQLLPPLDAGAFAALKSDIAARGVQVPVEVDEAGNLLDGHHRVRAWTELRAEGLRLPAYPRVVRRFETEEDKVAHALALNLARRHLGPAERAQAVADLRARGWSTRRIAGTMGVDQHTVRRDLAGEANASPERVTGADGKTYRAARPRRAPAIVVHSERDQRRAMDALEALGDEAPARFLDLRRAEDAARAANLERLRSIPGPESVDGAGYELVLSDFRELELDDASVDAIICDPPYGEDFLELWGDLGALAARVLRPGRALVAYVGHLNQDRAMAALGEHLDFAWCGVTLQPGRHNAIRSRQVRSSHRPWLIYTAGPYRPRAWLEDTLVAEGRGERSVSDHPWRQRVEPFRKLVRMLTRPGELVLDPFLGQGTTAVAALAEGRRFLGADSDPAALALARAALEESA